jgi:hypothetical protein
MSPLRVATCTIVECVAFNDAAACSGKAVMKAEGRPFVRCALQVIKKEYPVHHSNVQPCSAEGQIASRVGYR